MSNGPQPATPLWRHRKWRAPSLELCPRDVSIVALDVETTGRSAALGHRITEIAVISRDVDHYETFVDTKGVRGRRFEEVCQDVVARLSGRLVVGHNIAFDLEFLAREFERLTDEVMPAVSYVDTMALARSLLPPGQRLTLSAVAKELGIAPDGSFHCARVDAEVALRIFEELADRIVDPTLAVLGMRRLFWEGRSS